MAHRVHSIVVSLAVATALIAGSAAAQPTQTQPAPQGQTAAPMGGPGMGANQGMMQGQGMHQGQRAQAMPRDT